MILVFSGKSNSTITNIRLNVCQSQSGSKLPFHPSSFILHFTTFQLFSLLLFKLIPDKMLWRQLQKLMRHIIDLGIRSHGRRSCKSPTTSTHSLVPDTGDDPLLSPVHLGRKIFQLDLSSWNIHTPVVIGQGKRL